MCTIVILWLPSISRVVKLSGLLFKMCGKFDSWCVKKNYEAKGRPLFALHFG